MNSGLAQHPWRAYSILAFAFVATQLATLAANWIAEELYTNPTTKFSMPIRKGYYGEPTTFLCEFIRYNCLYAGLYLVPYIIIVVVLTCRLPIWFVIVLSQFLGFGFGVTQASLDIGRDCYQLALEIYLTCLISGITSLVFAAIYRHVVSTRQRTFEDDD